MITVDDGHYNDTGVEEIGETREALVKHLADTATGEYSAAVLKWFDEGHSEPLRIMNGHHVEVWKA